MKNVFFFLVVLSFSQPLFAICKYSGSLEMDIDKANAIRQNIVLASFEFERMKRTNPSQKKEMKTLKTNYLKYKVILKMMDSKIDKYTKCAWSSN
jgi:hypothetical protein